MKPVAVRTEPATGIGINIGCYKITVKGPFELSVLAEEVLTVLEARDFIELEKVSIFVRSGVLI